MKVWPALGWTAVGLSIVILLVFGTIRLMDMAQGSSPDDAFGIRYVDSAWAALLHIVPGTLFLVLAPLQFIARIRRRHWRFHRTLGRLLVTSAAVSGVLALVVSFLFPAFGGVTTQAATVVFGTLFLFTLGKAFYHIRRREVRPHREWMIRTYALAMGVATIRIFIGLFTGLGSFEMEEVFGISFWLGFSVNLLVAETWLFYTRPRFQATRAR